MEGIFVLIPIAILGLGVAGIISSVILKLQRLKLEEARLRAEGEGGELAERVASLERELAEVQERLDFAERMLTQGKERRELGPGQ